MLNICLFHLSEFWFSGSFHSRNPWNFNTIGVILLKISFPGHNDNRHSDFNKFHEFKNILVFHPYAAVTCPRSDAPWRARAMNSDLRSARYAKSYEPRSELSFFLGSDSIVISKQPVCTVVYSFNGKESFRSS